MMDMMGEERRPDFTSTKHGAQNTVPHDMSSSVMLSNTDISADMRN
jgi:hypothetical protein